MRSCYSAVTALVLERRPWIVHKGQSLLPGGAHAHNSYFWKSNLEVGPKKKLARGGALESPCLQLHVIFDPPKVTHMHAYCFGLRGEDQRNVKSKKYEVAVCLLCLIRVYKWQRQCCTLFTQECHHNWKCSFLANPHLVFCLGWEKMNSFGWG